tara:strand:+ start:2051 stop:2962 length:912 start_codon:yes stop_codon:yes gene_type:complete
MKYFSDQERGATLRTNNEIPHNVWCGLVALIQKLINTGCFGENFPELCPDGQGCCGTDETGFSFALKAEILGIEYPLVTEKDDNPEGWSYKKVPFVPDYLDVLDLVQFCYANVSKPTVGRFHSYYGHHHIDSFDRETGRADFLEKVNTIFTRNGLAYELLAGGQIKRVMSGALGSVIQQTPKTSEQELNDLLEYANRKICNTDVRVRYEALKELWDAFERIKTVAEPEKGKKQSLTTLLDNCSADPDFRSELEAEAKALTNIGNAFFIRHSEVSQIKLTDSNHIEYLFHRLASLMLLLAKNLG